jgi:hypothetical protein
VAHDWSDDFGRDTGEAHPLGVDAAQVIRGTWRDAGLLAGEEKIAADVAPEGEEQLLARCVLERVREKAGERRVLNEDVSVSRGPLRQADMHPAGVALNVGPAGGSLSYPCS